MCCEIKEFDYDFGVNGYFRPEARIDRRELQLRWMYHYLKGIDMVFRPTSVLVYTWLI